MVFIAERTLAALSVVLRPNAEETSEDSVAARRAKGKDFVKGLIDSNLSDPDSESEQVLSTLHAICDPEAYDLDVAKGALDKVSNIHEIAYAYRVVVRQVSKLRGSHKKSARHQRQLCS